MSIKTNIPLPVAPLTGPDGRINEIWWRFFLDLFNRTGGGTGNEGTIDPVYSDVDVAPTAFSTDVPLPEMVSMPGVASSESPLSSEVLLGMQFPTIDPGLLEALYTPIAPEPALSEMQFGKETNDPPLQEMLFAPIYAQYGDVSFINISYSGQLTSTIATGTAPMVVSSTTKVINLNVDLLDGADWATPAAIGTGTPNTAAFTSITGSSLALTRTAGGQMLTLTSTNNTPYARVTDGTYSFNFGIDSASPGGAAAFWNASNGARILVNGGATTALTLVAGGVTVGVDLTAATKFGCNGSAPQGAVASGGAVAATGATNVSPFGYTTAAQANGIVTLLNNIRTALVANGIMS